MSSICHNMWLDLSDKDLWEKSLNKLPYMKRDIYYNPDYISLYAKNEDAVNCYIYYRESKVYVYPFIVRPVPENDNYFDISTAYGYGGPISNSRDQDFLQEAYYCFTEECSKKNIIAEVVKFHPLLNNHLLLKKYYNGIIKEMCFTVCVDVNLDERYRWEKIYTHSNRKNINKAKRNNLKLRIGQDEELWESFQELYSKTMVSRKAKSYYYFPKKYFNELRNNLSNNYILISCIFEGEIVAVMLVLLGTEYAHCHLIGSNNEFRGLGVNNLLHHELIMWCKEKGYSKLHLGGGRGNELDDSLLRFKNNFSSELTPFYVGESIMNIEIYNKLCKKYENKDESKHNDNLFKYRANN